MMRLFFNQLLSEVFLILAVSKAAALVSATLLSQHLEPKQNDADHVRQGD